MSRELEAAGAGDTKWVVRAGAGEAWVPMVTNLMGPFSSMNFVLDEQLAFKRRTT